MPSQDKRRNPDPNTWDDPTGSNYDPTPKATLARGSAGSTTEAAPATYPLVVQNIGGAGEKYFIYDAKNDIHFIVLHLDTCTNYRDNTPSGYTGAYCGQAITGQPDIYAVFYKLIPTTCPAGYAVSGNNCVLADPSQVMKPPTVPCEVVFDTNTNSWQSDARNPNCSGFDGSIQTNGNNLHVTDASGHSADITRNPNGGYTATVPTADGGSNTITTGPYSPSAGGDGKPGFPITGITTTPGTGSGTGGNGSGGNGTGTGTTGNGNGSCGGTDQVPCSINDSGFDGLTPPSSDDVGTAWDERITNLDDLKDQGNFGIDNSWLPNLLPGPVVNCQPMNFPVHMQINNLLNIDDVIKSILNNSLFPPSAPYR